MTTAILAAILCRVTAHVQNSVEADFKKSKQSQINKLSLLQAKKTNEKVKDRYRIDLAGTQMKRWVKVFSKYKPTETEIGVLAKGLNFSIAPQCVPIKEVVTMSL